MNAIVVFFVPTRDGQPLTEQTVALSLAEILQRCVDAGVAKQNSSEQTTPPFWTWFIQNPRSHAA